MQTSTLLHLLHLCDPALPVGGFAHSAGLETYTQLGIVHDRATATLFVHQQLRHNLLYNDAALASLAYTAAQGLDVDAISELDDLCSAIKLPLELRTSSEKLGTRLLKIFAGQFPYTFLSGYQQRVKKYGAKGNYCIVYGLVAGALQIPMMEALTGFYYNAAAGLVTNAVKLVPLGQQQGQEILVDCLALINELVPLTLRPDKSKVGLGCTGFDIRSMQHEQLYSRLYMS